MTHYDTGRRLEYKVRDDLRENGYEVIRSAGSKSPVDLVAFKAGQVLLVQVKNKRNPGPAEREALLRLSRGYGFGFLAIVAIRGKKGGIEYRQLTGTAPGDWQPWVMDEVA